MKKDEILEKSRQENKNQDVYEKEILRLGGNYGSVVAAILATVFFTVQILLGYGMDYGLYAIVFSIPATGFTVKAIKLKRKHEIFVAIIYIIATILFTAAHIYQLFSAAPAL